LLPLLALTGARPDHDGLLGVLADHFGGPPSDPDDDAPLARGDREDGVGSLDRNSVRGSDGLLGRIRRCRTLEQPAVNEVDVVSVGRPDDDGP
jgi:hypothetical protein